MGELAAWFDIPAADRVLETDSVNTADEAIVKVRSLNVGDKIKIKYQRQGVTKEVSLVLIAAK